MTTFLRISVFAVAAVGLYAQTATPIVPSTVTTGVIGVAEGQAVRVNALNPGVLPPAVGMICSAQLSFVGEDGKVIKTGMVTVNPGSEEALSLDGDVELKLIGAERRELRATISSSCTLIGTVEIYDKFTGRTQAVLGGMHAVPAPPATATTAAN